MRGSRWRTLRPIHGRDRSPHISEPFLARWSLHRDPRRPISRVYSSTVPPQSFPESPFHFTGSSASRSRAEKRTSVPGSSESAWRPVLCGALGTAHRTVAKGVAVQRRRTGESHPDATERAHALRRRVRGARTGHGPNRRHRQQRALGVPVRLDVRSR